MHDLILKELSALGISVEDGKYTIGDEELDRKSFVSRIRSMCRKNKRLLWTMWHEVSSELWKESKTSSSNTTLKNIFMFCMENLYDLSSLFEDLEKCGIVYKISLALDRDINSFSNLTMSRIIDYYMAISWLTHLVRKDLYILALVEKLSGKRETTAIGVAGPWSRTDLPMRERVFTWDDISEEVAGRARDKRKQRRYRMGLEQYKDPWPNEGFYWREIRNEPFSWGDESSNPYPHRNVLWQN